jgi:thiamine kinase-like enzyme
VIAAVRGCPALAFAHGDLLLRNLVRDGGDVAWIDWECAGAHPRDWDLALLWVGLPADVRPRVEAVVRDDASSTGRWAAFLAGVAFALAREIKFRVFSFRRPRTDAVVARLEDTLADVLARL